MRRKHSEKGPNFQPVKEQQQDKDAETERRETLFIANCVPLLLFYDADFASSHQGHLILAIHFLCTCIAVL